MAKSKVRIGRFSDFAIKPNRRARRTDYPINDAKSSYRFLKTIRSIDDAADIPEHSRKAAYLWLRKNQISIRHEHVLRDEFEEGLPTTLSAKANERALIASARKLLDGLPTANVCNYKPPACCQLGYRSHRSPANILIRMRWSRARASSAAVCIEDLIRVDAVMETPKVAE